MLCGCQRGGRLTSDEMQTVHRVTRDMVEAYACLELLFQALARQVRVRMLAYGQSYYCSIRLLFV